MPEWSPALTTWELRAFDAAQKETFSGCTIGKTTDSQWAQASRGFKFGGLSLRSAADHAAQAFVASYTATLKLYEDLDPVYQWEGPEVTSHIAKSIDAYNTAVGVEDRLDPQSVLEPPPSQQSLSQAVDRQTHAIFYDSLTPSEKKALNSEMLQGASDFLEATPSKELNLAWDPVEFVTEIRIRLLDDFYPVDSWCPMCDCVLDRKGRHAGVSSGGGDRTRRHHAARNRVGTFSSAAKLKI